METTNDEILLKFPVKLRRNIQELWIDGPIGLSCMNPRITVNTRRQTNANAPKASSFILDVPYAGRHVSWEIIFNEENWSFAPDFDFINDAFLLDPDIDVIQKEVPTLAEWNVDEPKSLVTVVREFLVLYKKYQLDRLQEERFHRQNTEYMLLTGDMGIPADCIEVLIDHNDQVHFLISIQVDFSNLPPYSNESYFKNNQLLNPCEDAATLKVCFTGSKVSTQLILSPRLEDVIGSSSQLHIPAYNKDSGLIEYVPAISNLIIDKIHHIADGYRKRNEYISALLAFQPGSIVEYDNLMFSKATLLLQVEQTYALVMITLSKKFPQEKPVLQMNSICYELSKKPVVENITAYPYSSKWTREEMVQKLLAHLVKAIPKFKNDSLEYQEQAL